MVFWAICATIHLFIHKLTIFANCAKVVAHDKLIIIIIIIITIIIIIIIIIIVIVGTKWESHW